MWKQDERNWKRRESPRWFIMWGMAAYAADCGETWCPVWAWWDALMLSNVTHCVAWKASIVTGVTERRTKKGLWGGIKKNCKQQMGWNVDALIRMGTHRKAGEDVCSCSHANADHAVDPVEEPMVTEGLERNSQFMHVIIDQPSTKEGHSLELSHHWGQHFSQFVHGWVAITADGWNTRANSWINLSINPKYKHSNTFWSNGWTMNVLH